MKLIDLEPRWIHPNLFVFLCPHCQKVYLTCKNVQMTHKEQRLIFEKGFGPDWNSLIVPCKPEASWSISGTVPTDTNGNYTLDSLGLKC